MDISTNSKFEIRKLTTQEGNPYEFVANAKCEKCDNNYRLDEDLFQSFKEYSISKNLKVDNQTVSFVLYYDLSISQSLSITDEHIAGISVYNVEGEKLMHHLYIKNEKNNFAEVENVKIAVPAITFNHMAFYLENYVFSESQNKSVIILSGDYSIEVLVENYHKYRKTPLQFEMKAKKRMQDPQIGRASCRERV